MIIIKYQELLLIKNQKIEVKSIDLLIIIEILTQKINNKYEFIKKLRIQVDLLFSLSYNIDKYNKKQYSKR